MSSKKISQRQNSKNYQDFSEVVPRYRPLPTSPPVAMDNSGLNETNRIAADDVDRASAGCLPSTYSSQQLMPSDTDSSGVQDSRGRRCFTRSRRFTVIVLCFVNLINYMDRYTTAGVLGSIQEDFNIGDAEGGFLQTAFVLSYMVCAPAFGYLGDRYSRRWIMAIGVFLWSTTTLLGSFMQQFGWFVTFRALVGIGEASYSTIAPTIISDLFVHDMRSKMLALFYFAIPVGSGFGYIVGSETARIAGDWRWALRVTPALGIAAVVLLLLIKDPKRGESEGSHQLESTSYKEDIVDLVKNRSFMLSTAGFTCVAFVAGALSWWGPKFIYLGLRMQPGNENLQQTDVSYKFGIVAMIAGLFGVPLGSILAQRLRPRWESCDPYICAVGLLTSAPAVYLALVTPQTSETACFFLVFLAQISLNLCWSIVADILLYVVVPTRRGTAEAFQILFSHAFGDAGSPYLVGVLSEAFKKYLRNNPSAAQTYSIGALESYSLTLDSNNFNATDLIQSSTSPTTTTTTTTSAISSLVSNVMLRNDDSNNIKFEALQYALFSTSFVEVLGGVFFLITAVFILQDKNRARQAVRDASPAGPNRREVDID